MARSLSLSDSMHKTMEHDEKVKLASSLYRLLCKVRNQQLRTVQHFTNKELEMFATLFVVEEVCGEKYVDPNPDCPCHETASAAKRKKGPSPPLRYE